jgi:hypothetical protein
MVRVAYITNQFPAQVEWYVVDEILELRRRGVKVIPCSARKVNPESLPADLQELARQTLSLQPFRWLVLLLALWIVCVEICLDPRFAGARLTSK